VLNKAQGCKGATAQRRKGVKAQGHKGARAQGRKGIMAQGHKGTRAGKNFNEIYREKSPGEGSFAFWVQGVRRAACGVRRKGSGVRSETPLCRCAFIPFSKTPSEF